MLDEDLLDDAERLAETDRSAVLRAVASAGAQVRQGSHLAREAGVDRLAGTDRHRAVVVLACGVAALCGDLVAALLAPTAAAPVIVLRDPQRLPLWVGVADVVVAGSHTGAEDDLLLAFDEAARRGASVLGVGPAGTPLENVCARFRGAFLPTSVGWPLRAALWALATPMLLAAHAMRAVSVGYTELDRTADLLDTIAERCRMTSESFLNPAKSLALDLGEGTPLILGSSPVTGVAARRFAGQLAGCAAVPAIWGELPGGAQEFGGLLAAPDAGSVEDLFRDRVEDAAPRRTRLLLLREEGEAPRAAYRAGDTRRAAENRGVPVTELNAQGDGPVERFASLVQLGDFASVYLGLVTGLDPAGVRTGDVDGAVNPG